MSLELVQPEEWIIKDWVGTVKFNGETFPSMEDAMGRINNYLLSCYPWLEHDDKQFTKYIDEYAIELKNEEYQ